jgi:hypothetical protein
MDEEKLCRLLENARGAKAWLETYQLEVSG